jgi:hypothetical protein
MLLNSVTLNRDKLFPYGDLGKAKKIGEIFYEKN